MKHIFLFILILLNTLVEKAQNLVPNPSFEDTVNVVCGIYLQPDLDASENYWYNPTQATPDLYSRQLSQSCFNYSPNSTYSGPIGLKGHQLPRTGNIFAGIGCYTISGFNQREYVQSQLTTPMLIGSSYYVKFYVSLADYTEKYINKIGAYLSTTPISSSTDTYLNFTPQIVSSTYISDTVAWVQISGYVIATSAFDYITIGNFSDDTNTPTMANPGCSFAVGTYGAYYFVDDISVVEGSLGVNELNSEISINVYPNPCTDVLNVNSTSNKTQTITIYDILSKKLMEQNFVGSTILDLQNLECGMYFYEVKDADGIFKKEKFVKK